MYDLTVANKRIQREMFSTLVGYVNSDYKSYQVRIPNNALLSPRRIHRILVDSDYGRIVDALSVSDAFYEAMQQWRDGNYEDLDMCFMIVEQSTEVYLELEDEAS